MIEKTKKELLEEIERLNKIIDDLSDSEERYRVLVDNAPIGIYYNDMNGKFLYGNKKAEEIIGYKADELNNTNILSIELLESRDIYRAAVILMENKGGKGSEPNEFAIKRKDGTKAIVEINTELITINGETVVLGMVRDITDQKKAEEELRKIEERYVDIVNNVSDFIYFHDMEGYYKYINFHFNELGYSEKDLENLHAKDILVERHRAEFNNYLERIKRKGRDEGLIKIIKKDGEERIMEYKNSIVFNNDGEPIGVRGIARDITDKSRLLKKIQYAEKMEIIGKMAGSIAHDLNNTLVALINYPDMLLLEKQSKEVEDGLNAMKSSAKKASLIVNDLLTLSRKGMTLKEAVNFNLVIKEYLGSAEFKNMLLEHNNIDVKVNLCDNILDIKGSRLLLYKMIMNLIINSFEAIEDSGTISITTENRYVYKEINGFDKIEEGEYVLFTIRDSGIGISEKDLGHIFDPFFTKKSKGTGLGMAIVYGAIRDHGGFVDVCSKEGVGTTFSFYLPVTRQVSYGFENIKKDKENVKGNGEKVLIVDDLMEQREILTKILDHLNYSVLSFSSGKKVLDYLEKAPEIDLVLLDMIMDDPNFDGLETYKELIKIKPDQKVIIVTGYSESDRVKEALRLGVKSMVKKPYEINEISLVIKEVLGDKNDSMQMPKT